MKSADMIPVIHDCSEQTRIIIVTQPAIADSGRGGQQGVDSRQMSAG